MLIEQEILAAIVAKYEQYKKQNGYAVTCAISKYSTPRERNERHQGFLAGLMTAEGIVREIIKEHEL